MLLLRRLICTSDLPRSVADSITIGHNILDVVASRKVDFCSGVVTPVFARDRGVYRSSS